MSQGDEIAAPVKRFLLIEDVADELQTSRAQTYAMVLSGEIPAIKVGGRGQWRIERAKLEAYITTAYTDTKAWVQTHPLTPTDEHGSDSASPV